MSYEPLLGKRAQFIQPFKVILNLFQMSRGVSCSSFVFLTDQGVVSPTFRELSTIFSRNLCIAKIVLLMIISSWNFVCVPKAMLWTHVQSFSLKFSPQMGFLALCVFARFLWRARETLVKQPPGFWTMKYIHAGNRVILKHSLLISPRTKWSPFCRRHFYTFSWMKLLEVEFKCHRNLFIMVQLTISQHWFS